MFFTVDPSNGVAIYLQIVRQVKFAIAEQTLRPGQLLPSVRQLSAQLAVNPNTVARAFQQLQTDGVIEPLRGRGAVVCQGAVKRCRQERKRLIAERLSGALTEALQAGGRAPMPSTFERIGASRRPYEPTFSGKSRWLAPCRSDAHGGK